MKNSVLDLLRSSLIPILRSDITAGTARDVHPRLIAVLAIRAFPNKLSVLILRDLYLTVITANLAIIALCIQLGIHNIVVDELHNAEHRIDIVLHIRHLNVGDRASGGERLELRLEGKLVECVHRLCHVNVIGIGDIRSVGHALDYSEA